MPNDVPHDATQVEEASAAGARFVSTKELFRPVVRRAKELGLMNVTGVSTPSQAAEAVALGADVLKVFPATRVSPTVFGAIVTSLPAALPVIIAGGVEIEDLEAYCSAGASGFAVGKTLFKPDSSLGDIKAKACMFVDEGRRWARPVRPIS